MSFATLQALLMELQQLGVLAVHFSGGGEPTLCRGLFPRKGEAGSLISDLGMRTPPVACGLITNGSILEQLDCDALIERLTWIRFSVDAATERRYSETHQPCGHSLTHVFGNIAALVQARGHRRYPLIGASFVFDRNDATLLHEAVGFATMMRDIGVDYVQIKPEHLNSGAAATAFLHRLHRPLANVLDGSCTYATLNAPYVREDNAAYCWYSYCGPVISAAGDVYACCHTYGRPHFRYGNIADSEDGCFAKVWQSATRTEIAGGIDPRRCAFCRHKTFNVFVEQLASLSEELQDDIAAIMSGIVNGQGYDEGRVRDELLWLAPAFRHCQAVVLAGYHRLLDYPVFRPTTFVGGPHRHGS